GKRGEVVDQPVHQRDAFGHKGRHPGVFLRLERGDGGVHRRLIAGGDGAGGLRELRRTLLSGDSHGATSVEQPKHSAHAAQVARERPRYTLWYAGRYTRSSRENAPAMR